MTKRDRSKKYNSCNLDIMEITAVFLCDQKEPSLMVRIYYFNIGWICLPSSASSIVGTIFSTSNVSEFGFASGAS